MGSEAAASGTAARGMPYKRESVPAPRRRRGPRGCRRLWSSCGAHQGRRGRGTAGRRWVLRPQSWRCGLFRRRCPVSGWCRSCRPPGSLRSVRSVRRRRERRLHHLPHDGAGLGLEHLPGAGGADVFNEAPIRREDVGNHVGPHQLPAVDYGADGRCHFEVGDLTALPEGTGGQLHRAHPVGGVVQAFLRLRGQVDAGGLPEAEGGEVAAESSRPSRAPIWMKLWLQEFSSAWVTVWAPWRLWLAQWNRVPATEMDSPQ